MQRRQRGVGGLIVAVILLVVGAAALLALLSSRGAKQNERSTQASAEMKSIQDALAQFVAANGRLPCPANPADDTGDEVRDGALVGCTFPSVGVTGGTVPWRTIGIRRDDTVDPWSNRISYRVYTGALGSLAQNGGASMVNCDLVESSPAGVTTPAASAGGLCRSTQNTLDSQFLAGKGLAVTNFGTVVSNAAYVLVSHGPTGLGAYTSAGVAQSLPTSAHELSNRNASGPFFAEAESAPAVPASDSTHFDDVIAYTKVDELVLKAGQGARDWYDDTIAAGTLNAAAIAAVTGSAPSNGSLGRTTLDFGTALVEARTASGSTNISFNDNGTRFDGIGVGTNQIMSSNGEFLRLAFDQKAGKLAFTLINFGTGTIGGNAYGERVMVTFYNGATTLGSTTKQACKPGTTSAAASFSIDAMALFSAPFDKIEIRPLTASPVAVNSSFYLSAFATCTAAASACATSLADSSNICP